jgi:BON domain-containing protein
MRTRTAFLAALLALMGLAAACNSARNDAAITTNIKAKMFSDPQLKTATLDISAKNGVVTLTGQVPDDSARSEAFKLANETPGVTKVNDQMTVATAQEAEPPAPAEPERAPKSVKRSSARRPVSSSASATQGQTAVPQSAPVTSTDTASSATPPAPAPPPPPQPKTVEIPAGTLVTVRTIDAIDSAKNRTGEVFKTSLDAPIVMDNEVVVPAGADVYMKLVESRSAGHIAGRSELALELVRMVFQGKSYNLVSGEYRQTGASRGKRSAETIGGGAALGAIIGAIAGGGKGAAIGATVGGAGGTGVQAATKGQQIKIPSETRLDFKLDQPVSVTYFPGKNQRAHHSADSSS